MSAAPKTRVSTKGQVILPKATRDRKGWAPGTELTVEETPRGVLLTQKPLFKPTTMDEVFGCLHRPNMKPITLEEMEEAVLEGAAERYRRSIDVGD